MQLLVKHKKNQIDLITSDTADINECTEETSPCPVNSNCNNTDGSFTCTCLEGFSGDGDVCNGKKSIEESILYVLFKIVIFEEIQQNISTGTKARIKRLVAR